MSQPVDSPAAPAPTVRDEVAVTRMDGPTPTVRDDALPPFTLMQLPSALAGRYRIVQPLPTAGGEADLLLVDASDGQRYVAKIYRYGIQVKREVLDRLQQAGSEAVARLIEHGQSDGHCYEVLEYLPDGSLRSRLEQGPLAKEQARALVAQASAALADLHARDILHRDLKPENVLIRQWEPLRIALTDFGIASVAEATQHFTTAARTLRYAAPEAATGVIGTAVDYWSLGMVVLEAVSGRHPYAGLSDAVLSYQLVTQPVDCSGVAEPWRTLCRGLLRRDPKQRWGRAEIERWLAGDETLHVAMEATPTEITARHYRPYKFQGVECWTARELAVQLARHWDEGVKDLRQGFILPWLRDELRDQDLARFSMELTADKRYSEDERLLRLIIKLAPDLPPVYKGISLTKSDLVILGSKATQGDPNNASYVKELYERKILSVFSEHGETIDHKKIQSAWMEAVDMYEEGWRIIIQKGAPARLKPDLNSVLPGLLLINISGNFNENLRKETVKNTTNYALACEWFMALSHPDKAKLPHLLILRLLTHEADRLIREAEKDLAREIESIKSEFAILLQDKENNLGNELAKLEQILTRNEYSLILNAIQQIPVIRQRAIMDKPNKIFAQAQAEEAEQRKIFPPDLTKTLELYQKAQELGHPDASQIIKKIIEINSRFSVSLGSLINKRLATNFNSDSPAFSFFCISGLILGLIIGIFNTPKELDEGIKILAWVYLVNIIISFIYLRNELKGCSIALLSSPFKVAT